MAKIPICEKCGFPCQVPCAAIGALLQIYNTTRIEEKHQLIKALRKELNIIDCEPSEELRQLGEKVINKISELSYIREFDIKIGYVLSFEAKRNKGRMAFADCRKVNGPYKGYLPYDFIITFYEPNIALLSENQKKIVMWHELLHIMVGPKGLTVRPHDTEDFDSILSLLGIRYKDLGQEIPDILAGGDGEEKTNNQKESTQKNTNSKSKGRKRQYLASE